MPQHGFGERRRRRLFLGDQEVGRVGHQIFERDTAVPIQVLAACEIIEAGTGEHGVGKRACAGDEPIRLVDGSDQTRAGGRRWKLGQPLLERSGQGLAAFRTAQRGTDRKDLVPDCLEACGGGQNHDGDTEAPGRRDRTRRSGFTGQHEVGLGRDHLFRAAANGRNLSGDRADRREPAVSGKSADPGDVAALRQREHELISAEI